MYKGQFVKRWERIKITLFVAIAFSSYVSLIPMCSCMPCPLEIQQGAYQTTVQVNIPFAEGGLRNDFKPPRTPHLDGPMGRAHGPTSPWAGPMGPGPGSVSDLAIAGRLHDKTDTELVLKLIYRLS